MKFHILGANGFLGNLCAEYLKNRDHQVVTDRLEITDFAALRKGFKKTKPDVVINFAGVRAYPNIDWCEDNKEETVKVNVAGAINAMLATLEAGAHPIQIASGCIYSGGPEYCFTEEYEPNFFGSFYSRMRIAMQMALRELPVLQARIRMPLSMYSHPRNFINKIVSYNKVISEPNSVTLTEDLWPALEKLSLLKTIGILNLTNSGYITHQQVLEKYKEIVNPKHSYTLISLDELEGKNGITKARRSNCILDNNKALSLGLSLSALNNKRLEKVMRAFKISRHNACH